MDEEITKARNQQAKHQNYQQQTTPKNFMLTYSSRKLRNVSYRSKVLNTEGHPREMLLLLLLNIFHLSGPCSYGTVLIVTCERGRETETDRQRQRQRGTQRDTERDRDRQPDKQRQRETKGDRQTNRQTVKQTYTERLTETETERQTETET